ncbi:MAG TPA: hypothetical protein VGI44_00045 [Acidimicrobiales bacterium]|jgi:hypothetical protein
MAESRSVSITRIFAGDDGQSHFEALSVPLEEFFGHPAPTIAGRSIGFMAALPATEMSFRVTPPGGDHPFHFSPGRSLQVTVQGVLELEVGDGSTRRFGPGDFLLLDEQGSGQGHMSREIEPRVTVNIEIPTSLDLAPFRVAENQDDQERNT